MCSGRWAVGGGQRRRVQARRRCRRRLRYQTGPIRECRRTSPVTSRCRLRAPLSAAGGVGRPDWSQLPPPPRPPPAHLAQCGRPVACEHADAAPPFILRLALLARPGAGVHGARTSHGAAGRTAAAAREAGAQRRRAGRGDARAAGRQRSGRPGGEEGVRGLRAGALRVAQIPGMGKKEGCRRTKDERKEADMSRVGSG